MCQQKTVYVAVAGAVPMLSPITTDYSIGHAGTRTSSPQDANDERRRHDSIIIHSYKAMSLYAVAQNMERQSIHQ